MSGTPHIDEQLSGSPPIEGQPVRDDQREIARLFQDLERGQVEVLDQAGKRVIDLTATLLGLFFAVVALGKTFPPPYLKSSPGARVLSILVLACYLLAMFLGMWTMQPRTYRLYRRNTSGMREEFDKLIAFKARRAQWAGLAFWLGSALLASLVGLIIISA